MATKNIKVLVRRPGHDKVTALPLEAITAEDVIRIPRRVPFADIVNLADLKSDGFIRGENQNVSIKYGGNNTAGSYSKLGLTLPRTEKLILLAQNTGTTKVSIELSGNSRVGMDNITIELPANETSGLIYEIDLYDMGLHFMDDEEGSITLTPDSNTKMLLIARF